MQITALQPITILLRYKERPKRAVECLRTVLRKEVLRDKEDRTLPAAYLTKFK